MNYNCPQNGYPENYIDDSTAVGTQNYSNQPTASIQKWNYPQNEYPSNQSFLQNSNVNGIQNDSRQETNEKSKRHSAQSLEKFFQYFDPDLMNDINFDNVESLCDFYETPIFRNDENNTGQEQKITDKKELQIILNKPPPQRRKRIAKFRKHREPGHPCDIKTKDPISNFIRTRSPSHSPTISRSPVAPFSPNGSSYENTFLNLPQQQYYSSQSPSLSPSPISPSLSPSDYSSSASSSYCPQDYSFPLSPENQQQQYSNQLYPQWNYNNTNNQSYSSENICNENNYGRSF